MTHRAHARRIGPGPRARVLLGVIVCLVLAFGLTATVVPSARRSAQNVRTETLLVRSDVDGVLAALDSGDTRAAAEHLSRIEAALGEARRSLFTPGARLAAAVPGPSRAIRDGQHLLTAGQELAASTRALLALQDLIGNDPLVAAGRIDPQVLARMRALASRIHAHARAATGDLRQVLGGPGSRELAPVREQLASAADTLTRLGMNLASALPTLPEVAGAFGERWYLVLWVDESDPQPAGGRPLAAWVLSTDGTKLAPAPAIVGLPAGDIGDVDERRIPSPPADDPNVYDAVRRPLLDAFAAPGFTHAARAALAWSGAGGRGADGVIAFDTTSLARVAAVLPPAAGGHRTQADLISIARNGDYRVRQAALASVMAQLSTSTWNAPLLRSLGASAAEGHLMAWSANPDVQGVLTRYGVSDSLGPVPGDVTGLVTRGAGFAGRRAVHDVWLDPVQAGGSRLAHVQHEVDLTPDPDVPVASVATRTWLPVAARGVRLYLDGKPVVPHVLRDGDRRLLDFDVPGGRAVRLSIFYDLALPTGQGYQLRVDGQTTTQAPRVQVRVHVPRAEAGRAAWQAQGRTTAASWQADPADAEDDSAIAGFHPDVPTSSTTRELDAVGGADIAWHPQTPLATAAWWTADDLRLGAWLAVAGLLALIGLRRPAVPTVTGLALYGLLPVSASHLLTGLRYESHTTGVPAVHPATWVVLAAVAAHLVWRRTAVAEVTWRPHPRATLAVAAVPVLACVAAALPGPAGAAQILENLVAAPCLALLVLLWLGGRGRRAKRLSGWVLGYGLLVAAVATAEGVVGRSLVYGSSYAGRAWAGIYDRRGYRAATFLDHPLNTTLLLCGVLPLAVGLLRGRRRLGAVGLVLAGLLAGGSRAGLLLGLGYLAAHGTYRWQHSRKREPRPRPPATRIAAWCALGLLTLAAVAASPPGHRLLARFVHDGGSARLRWEGLVGLLSHLPRYLLLGGGVGSSEALTRSWLGGANSAENPVVMLAVDVGVPGALLLVAAMLVWGGLVPVLRRRRLPTVEHLALGMAMVQSLGFTSFGSRGVASVLIWFFVALAAANGPGPDHTPARAAGQDHRRLPHPRPTPSDVGECTTSGAPR